MYTIQSFTNRINEINFLVAEHKDTLVSMFEMLDKEYNKISDVDDAIRVNALHNMALSVVFTWSCDWWIGSELLREWYGVTMKDDTAIRRF